MTSAVFNMPLMRLTIPPARWFTRKVTQQRQAETH